MNRQISSRDLNCNSLELQSLEFQSPLHPHPQYCSTQHPSRCWNNNYTETLAHTLTRMSNDNTTICSMCCCTYCCVYTLAASSKPLASPPWEEIYLSNVGYAATSLSKSTSSSSLLSSSSESSITQEVESKFRNWKNLIESCENNTHEYLPDSMSEQLCAEKKCKKCEMSFSSLYNNDECFSCFVLNLEGTDRDTNSSCVTEMDLVVSQPNPDMGEVTLNCISNCFDLNIDNIDFFLDNGLLWYACPSCVHNIRSLNKQFN